MKKLVCTLLAAVLVCALALPVWAEGTAAASKPEAVSTSVLKTGSNGVVSDENRKSTVEAGEKFDVVIAYVDSAITTSNHSDITAYIQNSDTFTCSGAAAVSDTDGGTHKATLTFKDVTYLGGTKDLTVSISYPNSTTPQRTLQVSIPQCNPNTPQATATPVPTATPAPTSGAGVYVVAATVTDRAGGEVATVAWGDVVNVVLKVVDHSSAELKVEPGSIAARVNSSVFTYTGLGEISQLYEGSDDNGAYYSYVLLFRDVIYNGGGNTFNVDLSYPDSSQPMQQFSVTLGQCVDKDPNDPTKARTPNLVVRESSYGTQEVVAGQPFTLTLTVYASTGTETLNDVIVSLTLPEHVSLTGGSLSAYVGSMSAKSTREVSFSILPSSSFTAGVANVGVQMTGTGATSGTAATGSTTISVPITQPDRFEIGELQLDEPLTAGSTASVSLSYVNKGKNPVANLEATLSGTNLGAEGTRQYLGNLNAGTEGSVDFDLCPESAGPLSGAITLTYEGADGQTKTVSKSFSTTVQEAPVWEDPGIYDMPMEEPSKGLPIWGWVLIGVAVCGGLGVGGVKLRRHLKAKKLAQLEDDDEDI